MHLESDEYITVKRSVKTEITTKGSRFIARLIPVTSKLEAEDMYNDVKKEHYNATHNCFAYRIDTNIFRYSDDGEPFGTAGRPILRALDGKQLKEALCVVTRYFGGVKLGTGGLIRAYTQSAQEVISAATFLTKTYRSRIILTLPYDFENIIRNILNKYKGIIENADYSNQIELTVGVPRSLKKYFIQEVSAHSKSNVNTEFEKV
jgi:uncharacterized YigZ family protein